MAIKLNSVTVSVGQVSLPTIYFIFIRQTAFLHITFVCFYICQELLEFDCEKSIDFYPMKMGIKSKNIRCA